MECLRVCLCCHSPPPFGYQCHLTPALIWLLEASEFFKVYNHLETGRLNIKNLHFWLLLKIWEGFTMLGSPPCRSTIPCGGGCPLEGQMGCHTAPLAHCAHASRCPAHLSVLHPAVMGVCWGETVRHSHSLGSNSPCPDLSQVPEPPSLRFLICRMGMLMIYNSEAHYINVI